MAADIKAIVEKISKLTVLELCKLVKALRDKFGLKTSGIVREDTNGSVEAETIVKEPIKPEKDPKPAPEDDSEDEKESKPVSDPPDAEVPDASDESEDKPNDKKKAETDQKETIKVKPEFNPDLTAYDSNWTPPNPKLKNSSSPPPPKPKPKGEDYDLVYAWRYSDNKKYAKIGESTKYLLHTRMPTTFYPTGDPVLIGIRKCKNKAHAVAVQDYILDGLGRTLPRREWVKIDEAFNEAIDKSFISDPDELKKIFGENTKTEKVV